MHWYIVKLEVVVCSQCAEDLIELEVPSNIRPIDNAVCPNIVNESPASVACLDIGTYRPQSWRVTHTLHRNLSLLQRGSPKWITMKGWFSRATFTTYKVPGVEEIWQSPCLLQRGCGVCKAMRIGTAFSIEVIVTNIVFKVRVLADRSLSHKGS